ncbi:MAG: 6-bladed beta-propeller [Haliscomenobacter sp.]
MDRRTFIHLGLGAAALGSIPHNWNMNREKTILGHGDFRYQADPSWGTLDPSKIPVNDCHEMVIDRKGRLFLLTNETKNNIIIYNRSGKCLGTWGHEFPGAHGLTLSDENGEEFLWIADNNRHAVFKTTLEGKILLELPWPKESGKYTSADQYVPTETAIAPNGDIYVADGYGAQYILHYDPQGKLKNVFGGRGDGNPHFDNAHGICLDTRDASNPTLLITERQRNQLKRFSLSGDYISHVHLPSAYICRPVIHGKNVFLATLVSKMPWDSRSGFVTILDENNQCVSVPGGNEPHYENGHLQPLSQSGNLFQHPHDVCVDSDDNIYVAQWNSGKTYPIRLKRV